MESQLSPGARIQLDRFCRQYLQVQLEIDLEYPEAEHLRNDAFQQHLYSRLFDIEHTPPERYQLRVLKELTKRIEGSIQDWEEQGISDDIVAYMSSLLLKRIPQEATAVQQRSYVTYTPSALPHTSGNVPTVTLLEARNLLTASGITGLRTWEASLYFGNFLSQNRSLIENKSVLELGAGTGYISIICSKYLGASHVISTDGSDEVVAGLPTNFYINYLQDSSKIEAKELKWGLALVGGEHKDWDRGRKIDVVVGSDLTYDSSWFPALMSTFGDLFDLYPEIKIIIAATVRIPKTYDRFLELCSINKLAVEFVEFQEKKQEGPFYSTEAPFKLCIITKP